MFICSRIVLVIWQLEGKMEFNEAKSQSEGCEDLKKKGLTIFKMATTGFEVEQWSKVLVVLMNLGENRCLQKQSRRPYTQQKTTCLSFLIAWFCGMCLNFCPALRLDTCLWICILECVSSCQMCISVSNSVYSWCLGRVVFRIHVVLV